MAPLNSEEKETLNTLILVAVRLMDDDPTLTIAAAIDAMRSHDWGEMTVTAAMEETLPMAILIALTKRAQRLSGLH